MEWKAGSEPAQHLQSLVRRHGGSRTALLQILREIQDHYHHLPPEACRLVADELAVSIAEVTAVAEFYSFLSTEPRGRYDILVSDCITDHMLGKERLTDYLCGRLGVKAGDTRGDGRVSVNGTACTGMCDQGPAALVNGFAVTRLDRLRIDQMARLIEAETPIDKWPAELFRVESNIRRRGLILESGFEPGSALKCALDLGPDKVLAEIDSSGLRGRGGAGFKTAMKWRFCREETGEHYVVCNADEGEPGTFKDRVLLQNYADLVIEGMTLCAAVIGARRGFIYLRGEYRYLQRPLENILDERRLEGLLGRNILGRTGFDFDIDIHLGAGAYICGEESALIESLEGKRGVPRNRPPYPVTHGYLGQPTVVNNVETFAAATRILNNGGAWFAAAGTEQSKGSKILSISGDCNSPGIYEFPFGTRLSEILAACDASDILGVQVGGPSGTFVSASEIDRRLGFEDLATGGSFIVFDHTRDILAIVQNFSHFFAHESCGFCTPCRVGTSLLRDQLDKLCAGHGTAGDLLQLETLGRFIKSTSHCGLGQTAANPLLDTLERYPEEYQARLTKIDFSPGFDLDGSLATARRLTGRKDPGAHLAQEES